MGNSIEINEIIKLFPDEWVLLGDPVKDDSSLLPKGGIPVYHSKDKKEVCYLGREKTKDYERIALIYTGVFKPTNRIATVFSRNKI